MGGMPARWFGRVPAILAALVVAALGAFVLPQRASAAPPADVFQVGTRGCLEVGVRPTAPFLQPKPFIVPAGYDVVSQGYPPFGYDATGFTPTSGTNSCLYGFYSVPTIPPNVANLVAQGYCVQWAAGQLSGTPYNPQPWGGGTTPANAGYVRRILANFWPATNEPSIVTSTAQRAGVVAMAIHFLTDGVVLPPDFTTDARKPAAQGQLLYDAVRQVVTSVLAAGPLPAPADPTPTIDGPDAGEPGALIGPYTIGANATGDVTVEVTGAQAFTDAAGTAPFTSGATLPPGGQLWIRAAVPEQATITATGPVLDDFGTVMVGSPPAGITVQDMMLTQPLTLIGRASHPVVFANPPGVFSRVSATRLQVEQSVSDTVAVLGAPPSGATVTPALYGPVTPPASGGCAAVDWAAVTGPVRFFAPVPVAGDSDFDTPSVQVDQPGCYSFGATLNRTTGPPIIRPPGDPDETLLVVPAVIPTPFDLTTHTTASVIPAGGQVTDQITVTGLLPDRTMTVITLLLGPTQADATGGCTGVHWLDVNPPVAVVLPPRTVHNGTFTTPPIELTAAGCYSFVALYTTNQLTGGEVQVDRDRGFALELVLVTAQLPVTGTGPSVRLLLAGTAALLAGAALVAATARERRRAVRGG